MRGRELERVERSFLLAARPIGVRGREVLRAFLSFGVGPMGMKGRKFLTILVALKGRKKNEMSLIFLLMCGPLSLTKGTQESF